MEHRRRKGTRTIYTAGWLVCAALAIGTTRPVCAVSTTLVVNQIEHSEPGNTSREFTEIRNVSNDDIHVDLYTLEFRSASNATVTTYYTFPAGAVIPAQGYYLVVSNTYVTAHQDQAYNGLYLVSTGGVLNTNGGVGIRDASGTLIDSVAWGTITAANHPFVETTPAISPPSGSSIIRVTGLDGKLDHDDNSTDFTVLTPAAPQSTPYTPNTPIVTSVTASPARLDPGNATVITATVTPTANPVTSVTIDLTPFSGDAASPVTNTSGTTWTTTVTVPSAQASGPYTLLLRAYDNSGKYGGGGASVFVYPGPPITVGQFRALTPNTGQLVRVRGLVVSTRTSNAYILDADGSAGVAVTDGTALDSVPPLLTGEDVTITGTLTQDVWTNSAGTVIYRGELVLTTATGTTDDIVVNSANNTLPAPIAVTESQVASDSSLQGRYISITGATATGISSHVNTLTGDVTTLIPTSSLYIGVSRSATDQAVSPYPGVPTLPIPAFADSTKYFNVPWVQAGDTFDLRGLVGRTTVALTTGSPLGTNVVLVRGADDFVLTNGAKFISGTASPSPVEQGATALLRVVGYPVQTASVTADTSALGGGTITLTDDNTGGYSAIVRVPASASVGDLSIPVTVSNAGQTASGSITLTVGVPTTVAGDVNRSGGTPNLADVVTALKVASGLLDGSSPFVSIRNGDVAPKGSPDGILSILDAVRILRSINGLDTL
jgi:hypothetical protein